MLSSSIPAIGVLLAAVLVSSCGPRTVQPPAAPPAGSQPVTLIGAGASFPYPLYSKWAQVYADAKGVRINYQSIGSGGGIRQLIAKTIDFGASDSPMTDAQIVQAGGQVLHIPTVAGAVVPVYNLDGISSGLNFTAQILAGIYLGRITRWNDPLLARANPGRTLPDAEIVVVHRSDGSGTTAIWTNYLSKVNPEWKARAGEGTSVSWPVGLGGKGNEGVAELVRRTPNAIGYVELAYATTSQMTFGAVQNRAGRFITPSLESTTAAVDGAVGRIPNDFRAFITDAAGAEAYPIAGFTWLLVYGEQADAAKGKALAEFLWWAIHDGQQHAAPLYYAPLPQRLLARLEPLLRGITAQGQPLLR